MRPRLLILLFACWFAPPLQAHLLNMSNVGIEVRPDGSIELLLALDLLVEAGGREEYFELSRLDEPLADPRVSALLDRMKAALVLEAGRSGADAGDIRLQPEVDGIAFAALSREEYLSPLAWPRAEVRLHVSPDQLRDAADLRVRFLGGFRFEEPIATTLALAASGVSKTRWLVPGQYSPRLPLPDAAGVVEAPPASETGLWRTLLEYLPLGAEHILPGGIDHLLFVLALCLGCRNLRQIALLVSLFTLSHTLSLGAVSLGLVPASPRIVEPLILLTIVWAALDNIVVGERAKPKLLLVFCFGLIHGMGFAGALGTIGLPPEHLLAALLGFNLGVELAQIAFVLAAVLLLARLRELRLYRGTVIGGSALIAITGAFWMAQLFLDTGV